MAFRKSSKKDKTTFPLVETGFLLFSTMILCNFVVGYHRQSGNTNEPDFSSKINFMTDLVKFQNMQTKGFQTSCIFYQKKNSLCWELRALSCGLGVINHQRLP